MYLLFYLNFVFLWHGKEIKLNWILKSSMIKFLIFKMFQNFNLPNYLKLKCFKLLEPNILLSSLFAAEYY